MEDNQASGAKVLSMSDEERTHLLCAALLILPLGHQLRSRIESIFARVVGFAVGSDVSAMSTEQQEAYITDGEALVAELKQAAIEARRLIH